MTDGHWRLRAKVAGTFIGVMVLVIFLTPVPGNASPGSLTWTTRDSMPTPRSIMGVATDSSGAIYAFGGQNAAGRLERLNVMTRPWTVGLIAPRCRSPSESLWPLAAAMG
jgi:hypothetical protein